MKIQINWTGSWVWVLFSESQDYYKITAWDDANLTQRNWDERLNNIWDADDKKLYEARKKQLLKRVIAL